MQSWHFYLLDTAAAAGAGAAPAPYRALLGHRPCRSRRCARSPVPAAQHVIVEGLVQELITYFACDRDESITNPTKWTPKTRGEEQRLRGQIATLLGGMEQLANLEQLLGTNCPPRTRKNGARWKKKHRDELAAEATTPPPEGNFFLEELRKAEEGSDDEMQGAMSLIAACMASPVCVWRCIPASPVLLNRNGCL